MPKNRGYAKRKGSFTTGASKASPKAAKGIAKATAARKRRV
jgi:hypothetical protein